MRIAHCLTLSAAQETDLLNGKYYINIHTGTTAAGKSGASWWPFRSRPRHSSARPASDCWPGGASAGLDPRRDRFAGRCELARPRREGHSPEGKLRAKYIAGENNWLLFSALVEAALWKCAGECEIAPIQRALDKHEDWYLGDGTYGDGPEYHWDQPDSSTSACRRTILSGPRLRSPGPSSGSGRGRT